MADTKWADVAHYYAKSPISVLYKYEPMSKLSNWSYSIQQLIESMLRIENGIVVNPEGAESLSYTPILRHLEDMTEAEDNECMLVHTRWVEDEDLRRVIWDLAKQHKTFDQYSTHWLVSRGFDIFGLIESGQAIRKEVGNGL